MDNRKEFYKILDSKKLRNTDAVEFLKSLDDTVINDLLKNTIDKVSSLESLKGPSTKNEKKLFKAKFAQGSNAGNMGEGELYSILKLKGATAGTKGDMKFNGEEIEIKKSDAAEFSGTYTTGGTVGIFKTYRKLIALGEDIIEILGDSKEEIKSLYKKSSPEFKKFLIYLIYKARTLTALDAPEFLNENTSSRKFKNFDLKALDNPEEIRIVNEINRVIKSRKSKISTDQFEEELKKYLELFFEKANKLLFFAKAKSSSPQVSVLTRDDIDDIIDSDKSVIRGGFTVYINVKSVKSRTNNRVSKYSPIDKIERGYGINKGLIQYFVDFIDNLDKKTSI